MPFLLSSSSSSFAIANLEYRLAPLDPHPAQALDIISALTILSDTTHFFDFEINAISRWNRQRIYFVGHSAGNLHVSLSPSFVYFDSLT